MMYFADLIRDTVQSVLSQWESRGYSKLSKDFGGLSAATDFVVNLPDEF